MQLMNKLSELMLPVLLLSCTAVNAGSFYQQPDAFIKEVFADHTANNKVIWPDKALQDKMAAVLGHNYQGLRIRYWISGSKTAWVLDEIGKEKPITVGIVIDNDKIARIKILAFRESRGWEVKHDFFTRQFENASIDTTMNLDRDIDNISGATLSVRAVTKLARVALLLHQQVTQNGTPKEK